MERIGDHPSIDGGEDAVGGDSSTEVVPTDGASDGTLGAMDAAAADSGSADAKDGAANDASTLDLSGVPPPVTMTASVLDRRATTFALIWAAPSIGGQAVTGYEVRYAKVPITTANFDDATITTAIPYGGRPAAPGATDGMTVKLYIENAYYFAVEGTDGTGARSAIDATTTAVTAQFNVSTLTGTSGLSNEQFGIQSDGSGDVNGDGSSDLLVGSGAGQHAYLFLGGKGTFNASAPAVLFSGDTTTSFFGYGVAMIGDLDGDGREDIALSDPGSTPPRVFIYKGRSSWPMTMGPSDANYVITPDSTYSASSFGLSMARLGDFSGDGIDDLAIGAPAYKNGSNSVGRVVIILGARAFGSVSLPDQTKTITIDGDSTLTKPLFGSRVIGLDHFYSVTSGTTLVVSSPGAVSSPDSTQGRLYAFHGEAGTGGAIPLASADSVVVGPSAGAFIGNVLANLGPMVNSSPSLGSGNPTDTASSPGISGSAFVFSGDAGTDPFKNHISFSRAGAARTGQVVIGGGISGRNVSYSLLGDAHPDLVLVPQTGSTIQIVDGNKVATAGSGLIDPTSLAAVTIPELPNWMNTGPGEGTLVPDINGDGYPDFAIGNAVNPVPGAIAVYW